jgi:hypothetical protein
MVYLLQQVLTISGTGISTSPDGITWTSRTNPVSNGWFVTYGNGIYVAVAGSGTGNRAMRSLDGINWATSSTVGLDNQWTSVTYGNGLFVAVSPDGAGNRVMTSPDGITWTGRTSAADNSWNSVTYGNGLFVAVGYTGTNDRVMISSSSPMTASTSPYTVEVAYTEPKDQTTSEIIILQNASSTFSFSSTPADGFPYTLGQMFGSSTLVCIDSIITPGSQSSCIINNVPIDVPYYYSLWTRDAQYNYSLYKIFSSPSGTVTSYAPRITTIEDHIDATSTLIGPSGTSTITGTFSIRTDRLSNTISQITMTLNGGKRNDATTWATSSTAGIDRDWTSVTYGNGLFVAVASSGTGNRVMTSSDGVVWTARTSPTDNDWTSVTYGNGLFVAVSATSSSQNVMTSSNGTTWTLRTGAAAFAWTKVVFGNNMFVALAQDGGATGIMTSKNGINWTLQNTPNHSWNDLAYGNGTFIAVWGNPGGAGTSELVMRSEDGVVWTIQNAPDYCWIGVTYGNGRFVAISCESLSDNVMTSTDGITWTMESGALAGAFLDHIFFADGYYFAAGASDVYTSANANTWTLRSSNFSLTSLTYANGRLVGVNNQGIGERAVLSTSGATESSSLGKSDAQHWATSSTAGLDNSWTSVTYGNGLFVAVSSDGTGNRVMTSPDGITWTSRTSAADNSWRSVTYGNGLFAAVASSGNNNRVMTSPDGINWTIRTAGVTNNWYSVTYGNGIFVAVSITGSFNQAMTSTDGINWTIRSTPVNNQWNSVTYGNGLFVAVASFAVGNGVMTSPDGITWTIRTSAADNEWVSITYGNNLFVSVAYSGTGNRVMRSVDGITWATSSTVGFDNNWQSVTYGNGLFVAVAWSGTGNRVMTSPDGVVWTARTSAVDNSWYGVTYANGKYVAISVSGTSDRVMTSNSGTFYNSPNLYEGIAKVEITSSNGSTVYGEVNNPTSDTFSIPLSLQGFMVGTSSASYAVRITPKAHTDMPSYEKSRIYSITPRILSFSGAFGDTSVVHTGSTTLTIDNAVPQVYELNATTWATTSVAGDNDTWTSLTYGNERFVAVGSGPDRVAYSTNGFTWATTSISSDNDKWNDVTYGNGLFVAVGAQGTRVVTSNDGLVWTDRSALSDNDAWRAITYGNGRFVAVGESATGDGAMYSFDGINWNVASTTVSETFYDVVFANGLFVAVGKTSGTIITSSDGIYWKVRSTSLGQFTSVAYGRGKYVAVGETSGSRVAVSQDGINWTAVSALGNDDSWKSVAYENGTFVAVGNGPDRMMTSPDGVSWTSQNILGNDDEWTSVAYGNGMFVVVGSSTAEKFARSSALSFNLGNGTSSVTFVTSADIYSSDIVSTLVLYSTLPISDRPTDGVSYATGTLIGGSVVGCSASTTPESNYTCTLSGLTTAVPYYVKIFTKDTFGNYSNPVQPINYPFILSSGSSVDIRVHTFIFKKDNGSEATASAYAAEAMPLSTEFSKGDRTRLRIGIANYGTQTSYDSFTLQYATSSCTSWYPITTTSSGFKLDSSGFVLNGEPTTFNATYTTTPGGKSFVTGSVQSVFPTTTVISLSSTNFTEIEYVLQSLSDVDASVPYCFRPLRSGTSTGVTYNVIPSLTPLPTVFRYQSGGGGAGWIVNIDTQSTGTTTVGGGGQGGTGSSTDPGTGTTTTSTSTPCQGGNCGGGGDVGYINYNGSSYALENKSLWQRLLGVTVTLFEKQSTFGALVANLLGFSSELHAKESAESSYTCSFRTIWNCFK